MYFHISKYICIHIRIQSMQWDGTLNDSMTDKTLTLREIYEYASERALKMFLFTYSKTAISFNILFVLQILCLRNIYISGFQLHCIHIQSMQFPSFFFTCGIWHYDINDSMPTKH